MYAQGQEELAKRNTRRRRFLGGFHEPGQDEDQQETRTGTPVSLPGWSVASHHLAALLLRRGKR